MNENEWEGIHNVSQINDDYLRQLLAPYLEPDRLEKLHVESRETVSGTRHYLVYGTPDPAHGHACPKIQKGDSVSELLRKMTQSMLQAGVRPAASSPSAVFPTAEIKEDLLLPAVSKLAGPVFAQYFAYTKKRSFKRKTCHYLYIESPDGSKKKPELIEKNIKWNGLEEKINRLIKDNQFLDQAAMAGLLRQMYEKYLDIFKKFGFTLSSVSCKLKKAENKGILVNHGFKLTENQGNTSGVTVLKGYQFTSEDFLLYPTKAQFQTDITDNKNVHLKIQEGILEISQAFPALQADAKALMSRMASGLQKYQEPDSRFVELQQKPYEASQLLAFCRSGPFTLGGDDCVPYLKVLGIPDDTYDNVLLFSFAGSVKASVSRQWQDLTDKIENAEVARQCESIQFLMRCSLSGNNARKLYAVDVECLGASQKISLSATRNGLSFKEKDFEAIHGKIDSYLRFVQSYAQNICKKRQQIHWVATNKRLMDMVIAIDRTNAQLQEKNHYHFGVYSYLKLFKLGIARVFPDIDYSDLTALKTLESAQTSDIAVLLRTALAGNVFKNNAAIDLQVRRRRMIRLMAVSAHRGSISAIRKKTEKSELDRYLLLCNAVKYMGIAGREANPRDVIELIEQLDSLHSIDPPLAIQFIQLLPDKYLPYLKLRRHLQDKRRDQNVLTAETLRINASCSMDPSQ